jgi:hypothetical protein
VEVHGTRAYLAGQLGFDPLAGIGLHDWLSAPSQLLLSVTAGAVYHDGVGEIGRARALLRWYPHDVWLYLLAAQWSRIAQEEAFVARTAEIGDELGSRMIAARLVRDVVRLCLLMERRYAPYAKWIGRTFAALDAARVLLPLLNHVLAATDPQRRAELLNAVSEETGRRHNALGITEPVDPTVRPYYDRPYLVLRSERFVEAAKTAIREPAVRAISTDAGAVDQFVDSTVVLSHPGLARLAGGAVHSP